MNEENKVIAARKASNPVGALIDARKRNLAMSALPAFQKAEHIVKVEKVQDILKSFFKVYKGFYVNHRFNKGKLLQSWKLVTLIFPIWAML